MSDEITVSSGNVFEDVGFAADKAVAMLVRETLLIELEKELRKPGVFSKAGERYDGRLWHGRSNLNSRSDQADVVHDEGESRFVLTIEKQEAFVTYQRRKDRLILDYTWVPPELRGRGLAARVVSVALDYARSANLHVVPECPYVTAYIRKHSEYRDLLPD